VHKHFLSVNVPVLNLFDIYCCRTHLKLETLEDAVVLEDPDADLLQDKRGCPAYVSPEILRSHAQYSGRAADMWSLGVILYTMLVGR
jgi:tribbles-like protein